MQVLSDDLCRSSTGRVDQHPPLVPAELQGRAGRTTRRTSAGVKLIGATAHYVTADLDEGPIIEQDVARVDHDLTPTSWSPPGRDVECQVLSRAVELAHREPRAAQRHPDRGLPLACANDPLTSGYAFRRDHLPSEGAPHELDSRQRHGCGAVRQSRCGPRGHGVPVRRRLGFIPGITTDYDSMTFAGARERRKLLGIFQVSVLHNIVHLLFGIAGLAAAGRGPVAPATSSVEASSTCVLWLYGMVIDRESAANFVPVNSADNWLHLVLTVGLAGLGLYVKKRVDDNGSPGNRLTRITRALGGQTPAGRCGCLSAGRAASARAENR